MAPVSAGMSPHDTRLVSVNVSTEGAVRKMAHIFEFRQSPNRIPPAEPEFWIALREQPIQKSPRGFVLGRVCKSRADLEAVAAEIQADLDRVIAGARAELDKASGRRGS